nr:hypothetical protein [Ardenticatenales bacterium]
MSNLLALLAHALWLGGLALLLATYSYHSWQRSQAGSEPRGQPYLLVQLALLLCGLG